jgi:Tol biopolymer transport system component
MYTKIFPIFLLLFLLSWYATAQAVPGARADDLSPVLLERVSVTLDPAEQPNDWSHAPMLSGDGRFLVFLSDASNLVAGDTSEWMDVFVYDINANQVELVSVGLDGEPANEEPSRPSISYDGRYVAYNSLASNLVISDTNATQDVFLYDRELDITERISVGSDGAQIEQDAFTKRPSISADGRYVIFYSNAHALAPDCAAADTFNVYLRDRQAGTTTLLTCGYDGYPANGHSEYPTLSEDGKWAAFHSDASNLVEGDTNNLTDVFLYDIQNQQTFRVSVASDGSQATSYSDLAAISADGRFVGFYSYASNLVEGDTNNTADVFVHDHQKGITELISRTWYGGPANNESDVPSISADGRYVSYYSYATNLVLGDTNGFTDVFRYDRLLHTTVRVSLGEWLQQGAHDSLCSTISADGQLVAFYSFADNLVEGDSNGFPDVFVRDFSRPPPDFSARLPVIFK